MCRIKWLLLQLAISGATIFCLLSALPKCVNAEGNINNAPQESGVRALSQQTYPEDTILSAQQQLIPTTTIAPPITKQLPDYLKYCVNVDINLCLTSSTTTTATTTINTSQLLESAADNQNTLSPTYNRDINPCQCRMHPTLINTWYCCNITQISMISSCTNSTNWTNLHIFNLTLNVLDLSKLSSNTLHSLAITDGNITKMLKSFRKLSALKCLNISNNNLSYISARALSTSPNLNFLDISKNNLSRIPNWNQNQNITVDVSGNRHMLCDNLTEAILSDAFQFVNPETSFCLYNSTYSWFNSTEYVSIQQLKMSKQFLTKCPVIQGYGNCTCTREHIIIIQGDQSKSICHVDCSNLGLIELPKDLPDNTFSLNISNNKITSIGNHFNTNPSYQSIVKLFADNNEISSIYELEGTTFLEHFQRLYLRNNSLSKIPEYFLTNALVDRDIGGRIFLAGNKLQCDCNSAKTLKIWLLERSVDIPDYTEVRCRNLPLSVMELQENKLCQSPHDWTDYIYYLIASEVLMLFLLVTKVSYDYWVFKTAGYLPWPASKMPKLPCDWLCES